MTTATKTRSLQRPRCVDCIFNLIVETEIGCCGLISKEATGYLEKVARQLKHKGCIFLGIVPSTAWSTNSTSQRLRIDFRFLRTDTHKVYIRSRSPVTSTLLNLMIRFQPSSYWTIYSIWQTQLITLSALETTSSGVQEPHHPALPLTTLATHSFAGLFCWFFLMNLTSYHCSAPGLKPWAFFSLCTLPSAVSCSLLFS